MVVALECLKFSRRKSVEFGSQGVQGREKGDL
jgi:hypothetical protein